MFMIPLYILKPLISFSFSIFLFFAINVYNSYSQNDKIVLNEKRINDAYEKSEVLKAAVDADGKSKSKKKPVVVITGSTSGIGYYMAAELYRLGFIVIIASRSKGKCETAVKEIKEMYPNAAGDLDTQTLDVGDFESVNFFVEWFKGKYTNLNFLINNAGIHYTQGEDTKMSNTKEILSKQGYDEVFATNYMGHFLLTHRLLPLIKKGRVVTIASGMHYGADGKTLFPDEKRENKMPDAADGVNRGFYHRLIAYNVSKLAQVLHVRELTRILQAEKRDKDVQIVAVCPGWVKTNMIPQGPVGKMIWKFAFPTRSAIITPLLALVDPKLNGGEFCTNYRMPLVQDKFGRMLMKGFMKVGLLDLFSGVLAIAIALFEALSYGYHQQLPSEVAFDDNLAQVLYSWTREELTRKGFIPK